MWGTTKEKIMTPTMSPAVIQTIIGYNTVLTQALFTSQAALAQVNPDTCRNVDEASTFSLAVTHFALHYPGSPAQHDADRTMFRKILDGVGPMRPSIMREDPQQSEAGFFAIRGLIKMLVEEIPQDKYEATTRVALHTFCSAAISAKLSAATFANLLASPVADVTGERVEERLEIEQTIKHRMREIVSIKGLLVEWRQKRALLKLLDDLKIRVKTAATKKDGILLLEELQAARLSNFPGMRLDAWIDKEVQVEASWFHNIPDAEIAAYDLRVVDVPPGPFMMPGPKRKYVLVRRIPTDR